MSQTGINNNLKEGRRAPGSEWLKDRPGFLELFYRVTERVFLWVYPGLKWLSPGLTGRLVTWGEEISKGWLFNCQMCGQCILHSTGMTCPMTCPKNLRNGPCGGVRANGYCEVIPDLPCIWVQAWERSRDMPLYGEEIKLIMPPVDRTLQNTSAWVNMAEGRDTRVPPGWNIAAEEL